MTQGPRIVTPAELPSADVIVIGAGLAGCAAAFFAARAGLQAVVLERRSALVTLTTPVSAGAFRLQFDNPEEIALVRESIDLFDGFADRTGLDDWDIGLRHGGYLFASLTEAMVERSRRLVARQREWGLADVELLTGDEARHRWPWLAGEVRGVRYRAGDGWLDPKRLAVGLATAASRPERIPGATPRGGATFARGVEVSGLLASDDGSRVMGVRTAGHGDIGADSVIVAAGPFTALVAASAGVELDIRPTRRQKLVIPDLPDVPHDAPMTIDEETAAHWRPAMAGCLGLWTDAAGVAGPPLDPVPVDAGWAFGLLDPASGHALARVAPFWRDVWNGGAPTAAWSLQAGQYEVTPDRRPYLGPAGPAGLHVNGGYSGHGIMASVAGSRMVVDGVAGAPDAAIAPFAVDRALSPREHDIL